MPQSTNFTFTWPAGPNDVIVTGTFDDWKGSIPLVKTSSGSFEITIPFTEPQEGEDDRIFFKFIVDGDWTVSDEYEKTNDGCGFENNFIHIRDMIQSDKLIKNKVKIPEAGGLTATTVTKNTVKNNKIDNTDDTVHILPITQHDSNPNIFTGIIGGPGPMIPANAQDIKELSEIRNVDANELNERLNKQLKNKKELENLNKSQLTTSSDLSKIDSKENTTDITGEKEVDVINEDTNGHSENTAKNEYRGRLDSGNNSNAPKLQPNEFNEESHTVSPETPSLNAKETENLEITSIQQGKSTDRNENSGVIDKQEKHNINNTQNYTSNITTPKSTDSTGDKVEEEQKKPKKGLLGRLKKIFT